MSDQTPTREEQEKLSVVRGLAIAKAPYYAPIIYRFKPVREPSVPTMAVDKGLRLYYHPDFLLNGDTSDMAEVYLHECGHVFGQHHALAENAGLDKNLMSMWNVACDISINDDLADMGCTFIASQGLTPQTFDFDPYQEPFYYLSKLGDIAQPEDFEAGGGGDGGDGEDHTCGSVADGMERGYELPNDGGQAGHVASAATQLDIDVAVDQTARAIVEYSQTRGDVPAGLVRLAERGRIKREINWRQLLRSRIMTAVRSTAGAGVTDYTKRSRRSNIAVEGASYTPILPRTKRPLPRVSVVVDTSGSMGEHELSMGLGVISDLLTTMRAKDSMRIYAVDAEVHSHKFVSIADTISRLIGGGGTDMTIGIHEAVTDKPRPNAVVVFTDGETPWPTERLRVPVIAALPEETPDYFLSNIPSWIKTVIIKKGK